ncbi:pyroglutamyl-peptidase I [Marinitoga piezophila KA3]|uniref:Pyrrolidone-carboxylate peptidase n=1 Tax=Marinitoga piezophila (strain DSM 14283 / JCM 11233 / KA3) TaxID=443254 RepID=H2J2R4_MARPK|nr:MULTISPECIES: pyroglutamyl-peptidase I [Marinitoga]AEX84508.1 pyroglutamyl-peptidase I [Marinitoga piezophila KA3]APT75002.1 pyrrolidone-carboxylate peptidase [Marinitoga sp. 1137]NUU96686.1 pyrrolidone-carboxylate peptidase [Marinitoga sp. 1138]
MKVLVTGFEPFDGEKINPSFEAVKRLSSSIYGGEIIRLEIPTVFYKSIETLRSKMCEEQPDIVICVGQAGGRARISIERVAINIDDAKIPDNEGQKPEDKPIFFDGENAYFSNLPIKKIKKELEGIGIPAEISNSAGTFVCNHLLYGLMYYIERDFKKTLGGFIHVPYLPEQIIDKKGNLPSMSLENIVKALEQIIKTSIKESIT